MFQHPARETCQQPWIEVETLMNPKSKTLLAAMAALLSSTPALANVDIRFDYSYDSSGFFTAERRAVLEQASVAYESMLVDEMTAISPGAGESYALTFCDPSNPVGCSDVDPSTQASVQNYMIAAGEIVIFVGGARFASATQLGEAGPGGYNGDFASVESAFNLACRGQTGGCANGMPMTDFGPWGGAISFASDADWYFDDDVTTEDVPGTHFDFYSAALHEIGHVLGFGNSDSWNALLSFEGSTPFFNGAFTGKRELFQDGAHWLDGESSTLSGEGDFESVMDRDQAKGQRKHLTDLDFAALQDIGWQVTAVPEPQTWGMMLAGAGLVGFMARRRTQRG